MLNRKREEIQKPQCIIDYNAGKAENDLSDQQVAYSSPIRKTEDDIIRDPNKWIKWFNELEDESDLVENESESETDDHVYDSEHDLNSEEEADAVNLEEEDEGMSGDEGEDNL
nr:unnamed protein product [Callosobruchus chinensis]